MDNFNYIIHKLEYVNRNINETKINAVKWTCDVCNLNELANCEQCDIRRFEATK